MIACTPPSSSGYVDFALNVIGNSQENYSDIRYLYPNFKLQTGKEYAGIGRQLPLNPNDGEKRSFSDMTDPEVRRLEEKINSADRLAEMRLEKAMAEVNGTMKVILERTDGMKSSIDEVRSLKTTIIVTGVATVLTVAGAVLAGESLWGAGFASGQSDRQVTADMPTSAQPHSSK